MRVGEREEEGKARKGKERKDVHGYWLVVSCRVGGRRMGWRWLVRWFEWIVDVGIMKTDVMRC